MIVRFLRISAFTLAEVLIVIGIIGVVAAITIPILMNKTNEMENYTAFKKKYAEIATASEQMINDQGGKISYGFFNVSNAITIYSDYLSVIKTCGVNVPGCWSNLSGINRFSDGSDLGLVFDGGPSAILKNGSYIWIYSDSDLNCDDTAASFPECARIYVDVNASKKPNTLGKDIFEMNLHQTKLGVGSSYGGDETNAYGGDGWGMTSYCLMNNCPQ